jgi:dihydrofolate reductase
MRGLGERRTEMRKIIVSEFLTLDGVMQAPGDSDEDREEEFEHGGWQMPYFDEVAGNAISEGMGASGGFLLGRTTYELFAAFWPSAPADAPFAATMNSLPKSEDRRSGRPNVPSRRTSATEAKESEPG